MRIITTLDLTPIQGASSRVTVPGLKPRAEPRSPFFGA